MMFCKMFYSNLQCKDVYVCVIMTSSTSYYLCDMLIESKSVCYCKYMFKCENLSIVVW